MPNAVPTISGTGSTKPEKCYKGTCADCPQSAFPNSLITPLSCRKQILWNTQKSHSTRSRFSNRVRRAFSRLLQNSNHFHHLTAIIIAVFQCLPELILSDIRASGQLAIHPAAQFQEWPAQNDPNIHGMSGLSPMGIPRHRSTRRLTAPPRVRATRPTSGFFLSAIGCRRFLTVTDNHQKARSRPLRLPPSPDAWGHYGF